MRASRMSLVIILMVLFTASCSVISHPVRTESEPGVPFKTLGQETDRYTGKTVILGGYILETKNFTDETRIEVLQAPLSYRDEPKSRDRSEGRFIVFHNSFLDPELYSKDRKITVAGTLTGCNVEKIQTCRIDSREIYLWPEHKYGYGYPYYFPGGFYYRHGFHHHGYRHHGHHRHRC